MAPGAVLVGQVEVAAKASVWFGAVVHGALVEEGALIGIGAVVLNEPASGAGP